MEDITELTARRWNTPQMTSTRAFGEIHPTPEALKKQMFEIAGRQFRREVDEGWLGQMRFLTCGPSSQLSNIQIVENAVNYVAVSYCWQRGNVAQYISPALPLNVLDVNGTRPWRAPAELLHRTAAYAANHNLELIWIDQECINQDDPVEKERAIQSMDIVYQRASHSVAILDTYLSSQGHIDALQAVVCEGLSGADQIADLADVLEMLVEDQWFERAWTLQESTSAGPRMTILISCSPDFKKPPAFGNVPGEVEIPLWDFQQAMVNSRVMIEELENDELVKSTLSVSGTEKLQTLMVSCSNWADILWNCTPEIYSGDVWDVPSNRRGCSAALALTYLDDRKNSLYPDRLAILANLCNFETRIDSNLLTLPGFGFSVCALTLAILNGDTSLLSRYRPGGELDTLKHSSRSFDPDTAETLRMLDRSSDRRSTSSRVPDLDDPMVRPYGFSWTPSADACLSNVTYFEEHDDWFRLSPSVLLKEGLKVSGILWRIDQRIYAPCTRNIYSTRWSEGEPRFRSPAFVGWDPSEEVIVHKYKEGIAVAIVWHLLQELVHNGFYDFAETLWNYFRPVGKPPKYYLSRSSEPPQPFSSVFEASQGNNIWRQGQPCTHNLPRTTTLLGVESVGQGSRVRNTVTRGLLEQVFNSGVLLCGRPAIGTEVSQACVFFENCQENDLVFTPSTELGERTCISAWKDEAISWLVTPTGQRADGCDVLHCMSRKRGIWFMRGMEPKDYVLD